MKIYLAGPCDSEHRTMMVGIAKYLRDKGNEVYCPWELEIENAWDISQEEWAKKVFDADVKALLEADVVVAIDYGLYSDTGTAWEIGYAYGACIPTIILVPDETIFIQHSLMIGSSSTVFCSIKRFCNELTIQTFEEFIKTGNKYNLLGVELK